MSIFPWSNWIYDNDYRQAEVMSLKAQVTNAADILSAEMQQLQALLPTYRAMTETNLAFAVAANATVMSDAQIINLVRLLNTLPDPPAAPSSTAEDIINAFALWPGFIKAVYRFGYLQSVKAFGSGPSATSTTTGRDATVGEAGELGGEGTVQTEGSLESATEGLSETSETVGVSADTASSTVGDVSADITADTVGEGVGEATAEAAIEAASLSTLSAIGIGIVIAVGVDFIFGLIDGAKEKSELDDAITKLQAATAKVMFATNTVTQRNMQVVSGIVAEENRYKSLVALLDSALGTHADAIAGVDATVNNASRFLADAQGSLITFAGYVNFKYCWATARANNPNFTKAELFQAYASLAPGRASEATLNAYWSVLTGGSNRSAA